MEGRTREERGNVCSAGTRRGLCAASDSARHRLWIPSPAYILGAKIERVFGPRGIQSTRGRNLVQCEP